MDAGLEERSVQTKPLVYSGVLLSRAEAVIFSGQLFFVFLVPPTCYCWGGCLYCCVGRKELGSYVRTAEG